MSFEDRLSRTFSSAERGMPPSSVDWNATIARAKRERVIRTLMVTAAAVLVVGGAAWSARGVFDQDPAPLPAPANTPEDPTPEPIPTAAATERPEADDSDIQLVRSRVLDWVKALSLGDEEAAWSMMSPSSHEYFGSLEEFRRNELSAYAEGWGSWYSSDPPPATDVHALASSGDGVLGVVTVYGQVTKEGNDEYDADAVAFRIIDGEVFIEAYSSKIEIQPIEPSVDEQWLPGSLPEEFKAEVPSDISQANFYVEGVASDGRLASVEEKEPKGSQPPNSIASSPVPGDLSPGPHFVTIAVVDAIGEVAVTVVPFSIVTQ